MRKLCIIHVGMHKTGTSSIQKFLYHGLSDKRFHYANLQTENQSSAIYSLFSEKPELYHAHISRGLNIDDIHTENQRNRNLLIQGFLAHDRDVTEIISGEDIGYLNYSELLSLKKFLEYFFEKIKVIAYIRPLHSYTQSAFQELIKHGLNLFDLTHCDPNYARFEIFNKVFERENIILRKFSENELYKNNVVEDFLNNLGISQDKEYNTPRSNETISLEAAKLLYTYQKFYQDPHSPNYFIDRQKLIIALSSIGKTKFSLSPLITSQLIQKNLIGIKYLYDTFGINLNDSPLHDPTAISCEQDLLTHSQDTIDELKKLIGNNNFLDRAIKSDPESIAKLIDELKEKLKKS